MPNRLDLTGNTYDELTVVEMLYNYNNKHRTYCKCLAVNGDEVVVRADALQSGATHCAKGTGRTGKPMDVTGQKFGLLVAIKPTSQRSSNNSVIWECLCDCGNTTYVPLGQLIREHTLSCGCRHKSKWEMFINDFLIGLNIDFIPQKRFPNCTNQKGSDTLPFDFYLPFYNIIIEYDGVHHFQPVKGWVAKKNLKSRNKMIILKIIIVKIIK